MNADGRRWKNHHDEPEPPLGRGLGSSVARWFKRFGRIGDSKIHPKHPSGLTTKIHQAHKELGTLRSFFEQSSTAVICGHLRSSAVPTALLRFIRVPPWVRSRISTNHEYRSHRAKRSRSPASPGPAGFSLIEIVVAIGIVGTGLLVVMGLFGPLVRSPGGLGDAATAARLGDRLRIELRTHVERARSLEPIISRLCDPEELSLRDLEAGTAGAGLDPRMFLASRDGSRIVDPLAGFEEDFSAERFFAVTLIRSGSLSPEPAPRDETGGNAAAIAYIVRIRWPAFVPAPIPVRPGRLLPARLQQQETLFLTGGTSL